MLGWRDDRQLAEVLPAKEAKALKSAFGYTRCWQVLEHYPRRYARHGEGTDLAAVEEGDVVTTIGVVERVEFIDKGKHKIFRFHVADQSGGRFVATYFNAGYVARVLTQGARAIFSGKVTHFRGQAQMQHPDYLVLTGPGKEKQPATGSLKALNEYGSLHELLGDREWIPVYPASAKISSWRIMGAVWEILETLPKIPEPLDYHPFGMPSFDQAIRLIHAPDERGPDGPLLRLKYNEALGLALAMALRRADNLEHRAPELPRIDAGLHTALLESLPFPLTEGQQQMLGQVSGDLSRARPMSRLLQGEVGSGKTIVALLAMLQAVDNGRQCAMLVPTEVLAAQHARSLTRTLAAAGSSATVVALTGSMPTAAKREALLNIVSGQVDIVVGTHALIQDTVEFFDLGFVVVDEQHRFGVEQRDQLRSKGRGDFTPHLLVMTATPIPRTIAMTVFGDLAISTLRELPGGRKPIQSALVPEARPAWVARAWSRIREEILAGRQAYVVCPRIEGEGGVLEMHEHLQNELFPDLSVGLLHGRLRGEEKDAVMADFSRGGIDVLVATTVIEVGVDVPNATVMLVRESELFGVSQLHQLRGRVGRGGHESLCLFHTLALPGSTSFDRVSAVAATSDGFELANLDLAQRQEGDVLGTSQSGTARTVKLLNLLEDYPVIERANEDAALMVGRDRARAERLVADIEEQARQYLEKN
ncbi:ATP-dependent DNA helicase RecG [Corynebacterium doosanense]|uniref:ATP-dependent DNA helicase n=1 Tax=Corynebacterium doosanense CAU 212 = DSM 45436 TaxID=558173 RepID=A0A097IFR3_9CORY|nr:ATP-dependent DNA helicase RecG [Corynebacterium doosanense]AIT60972.1 ATP-dependent DNA helicase [Corynebacterium doosanense CAU 212 = DSM 45436]